ncbi:MAG TPA: hypothetical protein VI197_15690, partial [Polyangiaceae bacterium]
MSGSIVRIVALTHNLEPDFFDEDLLPNVLGLSRVDDRSYAAGIALQRKLQGITCRVLMAQSAYGGRPGLRTEIRPVSLPLGRLHAKCFVAEYERAVLLSIGSANLTSNGFRRNREVAGVLLTQREKPGDAASILEALNGAIQSLEPIKATWLPPVLDDLAAVRDKVRGWHPEPPPPPHRVVWSDTKHCLLDAILAAWGAATPIRRVHIVSPFWCEDGQDPSPLRTLLTRLRSDGMLGDRVQVHLYFNAQALEGGVHRPAYPAGFQVVYADFPGVQMIAHAVRPDVDASDVDFKVELNATRSLHAKVLLLEGEHTALAYAGSANFTRRGLGLSKAGNIEAGWLLHGNARELRPLIPPALDETEVIASGSVATGGPAGEEDGPYFPEFMLEATLRPDPDQADVLQLVLAWSESAPSRFEVQRVVSEVDGGAYGGTSLLTADGSAGQAALALDADGARALLQTREVWVHNHDIGQGGAFPVNLTADARLLLPLAPGATRPGEEALLAYYQGKLSFEELYPEPQPESAARQPLDSLERSGVDTTHIQSYRIRAFVEALPGMLNELTSVCGPRPLLELTFLGDTSPVGLARCIEGEARCGQKTPTAAAFQLVEILRVIREAARHVGEREPAVLADVVAEA